MPRWLLCLALGCSGGKDSEGTHDTPTGSRPECTFEDAGLSACLAEEPAGTSTKTPYEEYVYGSRSGEAEVVDVGDHLASACSDAWGVGGPAVALVSEPNVVWLRLRHDDGSEVTLGVKADGFDGAALPVGTALHYDFASAEFGWSPHVGHLEVRDASGGLVVWIAEGGRLEDIAPPPELSLARGTPTCWASSECLDDGWQEVGVVVEVGPEQVEVPPHGTEEVGGLQVRLGAYEEQIGTTTTCLDFFIADVKVAAWPL